MSAGMFASTHLVPQGGMSAWTAADGTLPPAARLDPGLEVQVLDRAGDWAHIACSNGWTAWVDGRRLVTTATPPPPSIPPVPASAPVWTPTHVVPAGGLDAWLMPDGRVAPSARLSPQLEVQVLGESGAWTQVLCSNGWSAWVDGTRLQPRSTAAPPPATARPTTASSSRGRAVGPFALVGAALVVASTFLPWLGLGGININAWDLRLIYVVTVGEQGVDNDVRLGVGLLIVLLIAIPVLLRRPVPAIGLVGFVAFALAVLAAILGFRQDPRLDLGAGLFMAAAGGVAILVDRPLTRRLFGAR